jgi:GDP-L-fucose synthase
VSRVLVTGGGGFLGSRLTERLRDDGHDVVAARRADYDLTSMDDTARLFDDASPELVFHLAAEVGGIGANRANPGRYWFANLMMGAHVLEQVRLHGTPKLVVAGTVCAYPKLTPVPFREDDLWSGYPEETNAPYGVAKKTVLVGAQAYREQYGTNAVFLLPTNLYGPGDNFDPNTSHVIPALIRKCLEAKEQGQNSLTAWGDGSPTREFLYVADAAEGTLLASERYNDPEPVNLGTASEISVKELLSTIADLTGFKGQILWDPSKPNGQPRRKLDASRAKTRFGFVAQTPFAMGLRQTVAWYESFSQQPETHQPSLPAASM